MHNNVYYFFDNMLIVFNVNSFVEKIKKFNKIVFIYKYVDKFVTFDFYV